MVLEGVSIKDTATRLGAKGCKSKFFLENSFCHLQKDEILDSFLWILPLALIQQDD